MSALLAFEGVTKRRSGFGWRSEVVFDQVSFEIDERDAVAVWGEARAGKSTLLRLAAGIDSPDAGVVRFRGRDLLELRDEERALLLRRSIGFAPSAVDPWVWGARRSEGVIEHVGASLISDGRSSREAEAAARRVLDRVGAGKCAHALTHELSPGERTRVAIARALVREPELLLVDEPAASQSPSVRDDLREMLRWLNRECGLAVIAASEDLGVLRGCRRFFSVGDGRLLSSDREGAVVPFPRRSERRQAPGQ